MGKNGFPEVAPSKSTNKKIRVKKTASQKTASHLVLQRRLARLEEQLVELRLANKRLKNDVAKLKGAEVKRPSRTVGKKIEKALRESEEKFRSFVENANDILFSLNLEGVFTYVSPKWTELLGYDAGEVIGKRSIDFIHPDDSSQLRESFRQTIETGTKKAGSNTGSNTRTAHGNGIPRVRRRCAMPEAESSRSRAFAMILPTASWRNPNGRLRSRPCVRAKSGSS